MARYEHLPIYKKAMDIAVRIEEIVRNFTRYNKYSLGSDLRKISQKILKSIISSNSRVEKSIGLEKLREEIEELIVLIRIGKEIKAFKSFNSFKYLISEVILLSKQNEGWLKSLKKENII